MEGHSLTPGPGDALVIVDVQRDFLPGGGLAVPGGDEVVPVLNRYVEIFETRELPLYATRDWHPSDHSSFMDHGGVWPPHCVAGTDGAALAPGLRIPETTSVIDKGTERDRDAYSGFEGTNLEQRLRYQHVKRLFVGGLATDYCVLSTVRDALRLGFQVVLLVDAVRAVEAKPGDGDRALQEMARLGARQASYTDLTS